MNDYPKFSDKEILAALRNNKEMNQAITGLYQLYAGYIGSFIMGYGGTEQDA